MRRALVIVAAAAVCVALVPAIASAKKFKTEVTVANSAPGTYTGKVTSTKKNCVSGRVVEVWHDTNGNGQIDGEPTDFKIGTATTDSNGDYSVTGNQAPAGDNVIASVNRKKFAKRKNCGAATATTTAS